MLLYFIAFVRPQPIAVRRGERPERGRPTLIDHTASVRRDRRCMKDDGRAAVSPVPTRRDLVCCFQCLLQLFYMG